MFTLASSATVLDCVKTVIFLMVPLIRSNALLEPSTADLTLLIINRAVYAPTKPNIAGDNTFATSKRFWNALTKVVITGAKALIVLLIALKALFTIPFNPSRLSYKLFPETSSVISLKAWMISARPLDAVFRKLVKAVAIV